MDVTIPADWSGEKKVLFVAHHGVKPTESALSVKAEAASDGLVEESFAIEPGEYRVVQVRTAPDDVQNPNQRHMETLLVEPTDASDTLSPAPMSVNTTGTSPASGTSTGARAATPRTGDGSPSGVLAAGLAALGAAALTYERRRNRNERHDEG